MHVVRNQGGSQCSEATLCRFDVFCYATTRDDGSKFRQQIAGSVRPVAWVGRVWARAARCIVRERNVDIVCSLPRRDSQCPHFEDVSGLTTEQAAARIRADRLHVLVTLVRAAGPDVCWCLQGAIVAHVL